MVNIQQQALIKACDKLGIKWEFIDKYKIALKIYTKPVRFMLFSINPFLDFTTSKILKDKDFTHQLVQDVVKMPRFKSYLNPNINPKYEEYKKFDSVAEIIVDIEKSFSYPVIIKKNKGSAGSFVFYCSNKPDIENALSNIYNRKSRKYDYIALAEEFVEIKKEYRVVTIKNKVDFLYLKDNNGAEFTGNISPLHYDGARAVLVEDLDLQNRIEQFIKPVFDLIDLPMAGFDIAEDMSGNLYLIEINGSPSMKIFARDNGIEKVNTFYEKLLIQNIHLVI